MTKEIVKFHFQEIPLEEAKNAVIARSGAYSEVKAMLLQKLPELERKNAVIASKDRLTFAFGLPKGEQIPEDQRHGLCVAVNIMLRKADYSWRVTYSSSKNLFICIPTLDKTHPPRYRTYSKKEAANAEEEKVFELRKLGMIPEKIAEKLDMGLERARYLCYQKFYEKGNKLKEGSK